MKYVLMGMVVVLAGCAAFGSTDQCKAPTPSEAKITKRVWMK